MLSQIPGLHLCVHPNRLSVRNIALRIFFAATLWLCCSLKSAPRAQTLGEWFNQKKTQKKYLLAQITGLETYAMALEKGVGIAKSGLAIVSGLKRGDFLQHERYITGLKTVSPLIKNTPQAEAIVKMESNAIRISKRLGATKNIKTLLTASEYADFDRFSRAFLTEADKGLETLKMLLTDQMLIMTDQQRYRQISLLYQRISRTYGAALSYCGRLQALLNSRRTRLKDAARLDGLYGK